MSFIRRHRLRSQGAQQALGSTASDAAAAVVKLKTTLANLGKTAGPALELTSAVVNDPALPAVLARLSTIRQLELASAKASGAAPAAVATTGLGLKNVVKPLDAYIYVRRNPWALPAGAAAVIGIPFLLGYMLGKGR